MQNMVFTSKSDYDCSYSVTYKLLYMENTVSPKVMKLYTSNNTINFYATSNSQ
jgi:hypothetical protein